MIGNCSKGEIAPIQGHEPCGGGPSPPEAGIDPSPPPVLKKKDVFGSSSGNESIGHLFWGAEHTDTFPP